MNRKHDYYGNLHVHRSADAATIGQACQLQRLRWQPGNHPDAEHARQMLEWVELACKVLSDPEQRARYDAWLLEQDAMDRAEEPLEQEIPQPPRPWVRFWARAVDVFLFSLVLGTLLGIFFPQWLQEFPGADAGLNILAVLLWALVEPLFMTLWQGTPGKLLLRVRVRPLDGGQPGYRGWLVRSLHLWWRGQGCAIPLLQLVAVFAAYRDLKKHGQSAWDREDGFRVTHGRIGILRVLATLLLMLLALALAGVSHTAM